MWFRVHRQVRWKGSSGRYRLTFFMLLLDPDFFCSFVDDASSLALRLTPALTAL